MNNADILRSFYESSKEDSRLISKHGAIEFIVTTTYINKYLKQTDRIFEIGCGTGRYSLHYARMGYEVDALELIETNLAILKNNIKETDKINAVLGNALDLSIYADNTFDITLLLGPMYHLYTEADKLQCLNEAVRVTKKGGYLFTAYCQFDASMIQSIFSGDRLYDFVVENGMLDENIYLPISNPNGVFELHRKEQIDKLINTLDLMRIHYVGTDMFTHYHKESVDSLDERLYQKYIEYTLSICENQNLVGASNHTLDILQKK